jgi:hypothetical protein
MGPILPSIRSTPNGRAAFRNKLYLFAQRDARMVLDHLLDDLICFHSGRELQRDRSVFVHPPLR